MIPSLKEYLEITKADTVDKVWSKAITPVPCSDIRLMSLEKENQQLKDALIDQFMGGLDNKSWAFNSIQNWT